MSDRKIMIEMLKVSMTLLLTRNIRARLCPSNNLDLSRRQVASATRRAERNRPRGVVNPAREMTHFFIVTSLLNVVRSKDTGDTILVRFFFSPLPFSFFLSRKLRR